LTEQMPAMTIQNDSMALMPRWAMADLTIARALELARGMEVAAQDAC
jgi:hypothetical protein